MRTRSLPMCVIWNILTCGIYSIYWFICMTDEVNTLAQDNTATSGGMALLLSIVTCGIYSIYWAYKMGERLDRAKVLQGQPASDSGVLYLVLELFVPLIGWLLMQNEINKLIAWVD